MTTEETSKKSPFLKNVGIVVAIGVVGFIGYIVHGSSSPHPKKVIYPDTIWTTVDVQVDWSKNDYRRLTAKKIKVHGEEGGLDSSYQIPWPGFLDSTNAHPSIDSFPHAKRGIIFRPCPIAFILHDFNQDYDPGSHHYIK